MPYKLFSIKDIHWLRGHRETKVALKVPEPVSNRQVSEIHLPNSFKTLSKFWIIFDCPPFLSTMFWHLINRLSLFLGNIKYLLFENFPPIIPNQGIKPTKFTKYTVSISLVLFLEASAPSRGFTIPCWNLICIWLLIITNDSFSSKKKLLLKPQFSN